MVTDPGGSAEPDAADKPEEPGDDARRRFREALERKKANPGSHPGSQAADGKPMHDGGGRQRRQFRRKSG